MTVRGKTRHQLFLPHDLSRRLTAMAKARGCSRSDLLLEAVEAWMNQRTGPSVDDRIIRRLDNIARDARSANQYGLVVSESLSRFIRHQLIHAATLPAPGEDARALGQKRYDQFLDSLARMLAKGADNDDEPLTQARTGTHEG